MGEVWSFIELEEGKLHDTAPKMAWEARRFGKLFNVRPCGVLLGSHSPAFVEALKPYGLEKIYFVEGEYEFTPEAFAYSFCSAISKYSPEVVLFAHTPLGAELAARVAARLGKGLISNCTNFELRDGSVIARRPFCGAKADVILAWLGSPPYIATINLASLEAVEVEHEVKPEVIHEAVGKPETKTRLVKRWKIPPSELPISEAEVVIGVGNAVKQEFMDVIEDLAEGIGAAVGGSRIAWYNGLIPKEKYIGTSGEWLNASVYVPIGISGASQHVMGIKDVKHVIAVNIAGDAPIFRYAELGIVDDLYRVIPEVSELVKQSKNFEGLK